VAFTQEETETRRLLVAICTPPVVAVRPVLARECVRYHPSKEWECRDGPAVAPGLVDRQADGLVTAIYSYDYSLAELLRVAESMKVP